MILWTVMPLEIVLAKREDENPPYREIRYRGALLLLEPTGISGGRIVRVISSNPAHYLDPSLQPGNIIQYHTPD